MASLSNSVQEEDKSIVNIGGIPAKILTGVVDCEVLLYLFTPRLKAANSLLDLNHLLCHSHVEYGRETPLQHRSNGHIASQ